MAANNLYPSNSSEESEAMAFTDSCEVSNLLFSVSRFDKSQPRFGIRIFEFGDRGGVFGVACHCWIFKLYPECGLAANLLSVRIVSVMLGKLMCKLANWPVSQQRTRVIS